MPVVPVEPPGLVRTWRHATPTSFGLAVKVPATVALLWVPAHELWALANGKSVTVMGFWFIPVLWFVLIGVTVSLWRPGRR